MKTLIKFLGATVALVVLVVTIAVTIAQTLINTAEKAAYCAVGYVSEPYMVVFDWLLGDNNANKPNLTAEQLNNVSLIIGIGRKLGLSDRLIKVALIATFTEAGARNLPGGDRDSAGLFQMRPSAGWGTYAQVTDPIYAINKFFEVLLAKDPQDNMDLGQAAQAVEQSAYPDRYAQWEPLAEKLVKSALDPSKDASQIGLAIIGDSLTVAVQTNLSSGLQSAGWSFTTVDAEIGRHTTYEPASGQPQSGVNAIKTMQSDGSNPYVWVIELGTNDLASATSVDAAKQLITPVLDQIGQNKIVLWITPYVPKWSTESQNFQSALSELTVSYSGLRIADWSSVVSMNPDWFASDGVHYNAAGQSTFKDFLTESTVGLFSDSFAYHNGVGSSSTGNSVCSTGKKVVDKALDIVTGLVGKAFAPAELGVTSSQSLISWAFSSAGSALKTTASVIPVGQTVNTVTDAKRGDLVYWESTPGDPNTVYQQGIYLGNNKVVIDPKDNETVAISDINWSGAIIVRPDIVEVASSTDWQNPIHAYYRISSRFGMRVDPVEKKLQLHDGIDMAAPAGTKIYAASSGIVTVATIGVKDGHFIEVTSKDGDHEVKIRYVHLEAFAANITTGTEIKAGDYLGFIGNCNCYRSTGTNLHLLVHVDGTPTDPVEFFSSKGVNL